MSPIEKTTLAEEEENLLLELFRNHVREELKAQAIAAVTREIDQAVDKAIGSLNAEIEAYFDQYRNRMTHCVIVNRRGEVRE